MRGEDARSSHGRLFQPYRDGRRSYLIGAKAPPRPARHPRDLPVPPPHLLVGHDSSDRFLDWGEKHFSSMERILMESGHPLTRGQRVLDFGCGSGRMIRWLCGLTEASEVWGVDVSAPHIFWCKENLQPPFHFAVTTIVPHLPFEDGYFDLIYAGSVFTHIDDLVDSWLLELRRILKPNGCLYVTIHDEHTASLLRARPGPRPPNESYASSPEFADYASRDFSVFAIGRSDESQVFYHLSYFSALVSSLFQILATEREAYGHQTAVLLRKPAPAPSAPAGAAVEDPGLRGPDGTIALWNAQFVLKEALTALGQASDEIRRARGRITAVESTKFWKLRGLWFKLKRAVGVRAEE